MNGRPLGVQFKRNSAYVAQEDCFVPTMSANETLVFTATLTLPKSVTPEERMQRIEEVLRIMGLWRSRETQVGRPLSIPARNVHPTKFSMRSGRQQSAASSIPARDALSIEFSMRLSRQWCSRQPGAAVLHAALQPYMRSMSEAAHMHSNQSMHALPVCAPFRAILTHF